MNAITPAHRTRLSKVLGMIRSPYDNEALTAARLADRLVMELGVTWDDVLLAEGDITTTPAASTRRSSRRSQPHDWRALATSCAKHPLLLDRWEAEFLGGLHRFPFLSVKQQSKLATIAARLRAAGCKL